MVMYWTKKSRASLKFGNLILPDSSTKKFTDWYLLHLLETESIKYADLR